MVKLERKAQTLECEISKPNFWQNQKRAKKVSQTLSDLKEKISFWKSLEQEGDELLELATFLEKEGDPELEKEIKKKLAKLNKKFDQAEFEVLMSGKYAKGNAILIIHAGTGGTEAQDWAEMLTRMYLRYAETKGWQAKIIDKIQGKEAGIKQVTIEVLGHYAYGYLRAEGGIHRLIRLSPFDADHARHTSFALVEIFPEINDDIEVEIKPKDIHIETFRAGGAGGQHVNKTSSAVRLTHIPSGITVSCQNERSQLQNKNQALKILRAKLYIQEEQKKENEKRKARGEHVNATWGNQIRSYILHPYKQVRDHRTGFETKDTEAVLDGQIEGFIKACLKQNKNFEHNHDHRI